MIHSTVRVFQFVGILGCLSSSIYYLLCLWSASTFLRQRKAGAGAHSTQDRPTQTLPPVSILKPLKGTDPDRVVLLRKTAVARTIRLTRLSLA